MRCLINPLSKYWLRWTQERCQTKTKIKNKINLILVFYPGTVLQKANPGLSLRVLAGKSNFLVVVLSRKGNQKQTLELVGLPGRKKSD